MHRIARLIQNNLNLRVFLPLLVLALVSTWYGLFASVDRFAVLTGGLSFIDMQPWLTAETLFAQISTYSPETVRYYMGWSLFDYLWPLITFTTMLFISGWLFGFLAEKWQPRFRLFIASAGLTVLLDWAENIGFVVLVSLSPGDPQWLAVFTLGLHAGKLMFMMVFNVLLCILLAAAIFLVVRQETK
ncbi:MAG: hypothetical protein QGH93_13515 [Gammaproteobacteria bacterium]|jgi:hypothetical protein|nr:hypothetical protein [Chromatiales bacterium]MDP6675853.1 hypothetical protein [Gammaproteobacteria bacterium]